MINKKWCDPRKISILSRSCSPHLEHLSIICRPFYLPREFSSIIATAVYIPPQPDTSFALSKLHDVLSGYINKHPDAASIITGDFNKANLRQVMPNFHQNVSCPTRGPNTLYHCYTPFKKAYNARSLPAFGKSDHSAIFLTPEYKQRLVQEPPVERQVTRWSSHSEGSWWCRLGHVPGKFIWRRRVHRCNIKLCQPANRASHWNCNYKDILKSENHGWTEQSVMRLTITLPHTTPVFYLETWASTKHRAMLSHMQLELLNSDTGRELCHIFSSMTLDACGRDWRPSVPLEINPPQRWFFLRPLWMQWRQRNSAFNTIVPIKLAVKLKDLGLNSSLCDWIQDFLTGRPQVVKMGQFTSNSITLNIGAPQGCVLSPLLYSLDTHDCVSSHSSTSIVKFADDTVVLGLISNNDKTAYLDEVESLKSWCQDNCLSLNVSKTKELIVDFRKRKQRPYTPLMISGTPVERVSSFKYLGVNISEDFTMDYIMYNWVCDE